ncbi:3-bisphosphoglycerate-dependent phosphoglyceratemutase [Striga asiatica]|uniref:3-bisphosphoglycerate-dependent phosphoglyceratemutase n=1 Tax=Striga asiatica TaxID=4170 RepID=A0A5A7QJ88_STRAF|nr:3-bisphosphoglycerate-dependent phosphoglyceratemutase [Striga asiatica]
MGRLAERGYGRLVPETTSNASVLSRKPQTHIGQRNNLVSPLQVRKANILRLFSNKKKKELCPKLVQDLLLHLTTIIGHSSTHYPLRKADLIAVESKARKVANKVVYLASQSSPGTTTALSTAFGACFEQEERREMSQLREHQEHALFNLITSQLLPYFVYPYWPALANPKLAHNSGKRELVAGLKRLGYFSYMLNTCKSNEVLLDDSFFEIPNSTKSRRERNSLSIARTFLRNALRLEPTSHRAWLDLGLVLKSKGSLTARGCGLLPGSIRAPRIVTNSGLLRAASHHVALETHICYLNWRPYFSLVCMRPSLFAYPLRLVVITSGQLPFPVWSTISFLLKKNKGQLTKPSCFLSLENRSLAVAALIFVSPTNFLGSTRPSFLPTNVFDSNNPTSLLVLSSLSTNALVDSSMDFTMHREVRNIVIDDIMKALTKNSVGKGGVLECHPYNYSINANLNIRTRTRCGTCILFPVAVYIVVVKRGKKCCVVG